MTRAYIFAEFANNPPPSASATRVSDQPCQPQSADGSGPVPITSRTLRPVGLVQLQIQREILAAEAKSLRDQRQSKAASASEAEFRAVTLAVMRAEIEAKQRGYWNG